MSTPRLTVFTEKFTQLLIIHVVTKVFNVDICKLLGSGTQLSLALFARFEATHESALKWEIKKNFITPILHIKDKLK